MEEITNIEEKRLQIGYFLSRRKGENKFCVTNIYRQWCQWWREDFCVNGTVQLELYNDKLVLSRKGAKLGETQPAFIEYYNSVIKDVQTYLITEYDRSKTSKENADRFKKMIMKFRHKQFRKLKQQIKAVGLQDKYYVITKVNKPYKAVKFALYPCGVYHQRRRASILAVFLR